MIWNYVLYQNTVQILICYTASEKSKRIEETEHMLLFYADGANLLGKIKNWPIMNENRECLLGCNECTDNQVHVYG
jgi:hypothetical protein